jgi:hypothetical protein
MVGIGLVYSKRAMNLKTATCRRPGLDPRPVIRGFAVVTVFFLSSLCPAAALPTDSRYKECLQLLAGTDRASSGLVENVSSLLNHPSDASSVVPQTSPSLMVVSWHEKGEQARDVVVQLFFEPLAGGQNVLNEEGFTRARLGDELSGTANQLLGLVFRQVAYFGPKDQVARQQRAFQALLNGDMTLLREQTVDPLHVIVVMPDAGKFLPTSLRSRVSGVVVDAELAFGTWSGRIGMVTADGDAAEQVGNVVAAWREMALSFADTFASRPSARQLRGSLQASMVQVVSNRVLTSASVDARAVVLVSKEVGGHGDNCPPGGVCSKDKVAVCHRIDSRREQTLCVAPAEVAALLARGDHCGPCAGNQ